ncbi:TPA: ATP-binding protein [Vibrio parahaemolyticus]|uniref:Predicted ATP-binding protein involved in virulence n=3 Tax=Pseudomonadati TaxID=3379134 RepID=A0A3Q0L4V3_VIBVU|nr:MULTISPECIES: AAA family ATPase [Vibrio]AAO10437.1 Predicted ATP-binding protein involved in virulence [Vibrio vulnificus CMCP6]EJB8405384.1 ATP-binding protein [Vibrio parahaemolyticus]EJB8532870.1 ATP-binding protein [Vibrio parahaemolyticus]EJX5603889.1 ATP-binding protein [Vibrio parahaemolyticus]ELA6924232.1 ATP-binding protein [Vibrio parahaemolyticus]
MNDYRLIYLRIDQYKNVQNKGIRFTLDYNIQIDQHCVTVTSSDFGSSDPVKNPLSGLDGFSAIVGPNGSGKSNVLEVLTHLVCLNEFPSDGNNASGFLIIERYNSGCDSDLVMITNNNDYTFKNGEISNNINFTEKKAIYYNPIDENHRPINIKIDGRNLYRIGGDPVHNKFKNSSTTNNVKQFASFKESIGNYDIFEQIFKNSHASYVLQYEEIKNKVSSYLSAMGIGGNAIRHKWFRELKTETRKILDDDKFSINYFYICYFFLFATKFIEREQINGTKLKYHKDDISLLFTILRFGINNDNIKNAQDKAQSFLEDLGLQSHYIEFHKYVGQTRHKLDLISDCFQENEVYGGCIIIPFNQPGKLDLLKHLVDGNELEELGTYEISGDNIFSSVCIDGLSSGEMNIINFIGNLEEKLDYFTNIQPIVIFDEVEHTFHPEWQRLLINTLIKVFENKRVQPQVVLATHSPFILSDILNKKTLSLGNHNDINVNTFAANIHDILKSQFILQRSIGEHAANIIKKIAVQLEDLDTNSCEEYNLETIKTIELVVDQVGDPLLKRELQSRLDRVKIHPRSIKGRILSLLDEGLDERQLLARIKSIDE